jgi:hypothetical protein
MAGKPMDGLATSFLDIWAIASGWDS